MCRSGLNSRIWCILSDLDIQLEQPEVGEFDDLYTIFFMTRTLTGLVKRYYCIQVMLDVYKLVQVQVGTSWSG